MRPWPGRTPYPPGVQVLVEVIGAPGGSGPNPCRQRARRRPSRALSRTEHAASRRLPTVPALRASRDYRMVRDRRRPGDPGRGRPCCPAGSSEAGVETSAGSGHWQAAGSRRQAVGAAITVSQLIVDVSAVTGTVGSNVPSLPRPNGSAPTSVARTSSFKVVAAGRHISSRSPERAGSTRRPVKAITMPFTGTWPASLRAAPSRGQLESAHWPA